MPTSHGDRWSIRPGRCLWSLAVAALLAGCAANTDGTAVPASDLGHDPAPVMVEALAGLLLPPEQLNSVLQVSGLVAGASDSAMANGETTANDCAATWQVRWAPVYDGNGWVAVRGQYADDGPGGNRKVWQAVVSFPMPVDANAFYAKQVAGWHTCNDRNIEERYTNQADADDSFWKLGEARDSNGMLTIVATQQNVDNGWACERALTIRNNVAVDTQVCGDHVTDQAESVANAIAKKVPVK
jgi:PknH-like extracellular domain